MPLMPNAPRPASGTTPAVYNTFTLFTREVEAAGGGKSVAKDAAALGQALRAMPAGTLPAALGRLGGCYGLAVEPGAGPSAGAVQPGIFTRVWGYLTGSTGAGSAAAAAADKPALFFGLPSNTQQESVVAMLENHGCAVLHGPVTF